MLGLRSFINRISPDFFKVARLSDLIKINGYLGSKGLPYYWERITLGQRTFNPVYSIHPPPRFVVTFRGLKLDTVYLRAISKRGTEDYTKMARYFYPGLDYAQVPDEIDETIVIKMENL